MKKQENTVKITTVKITGGARLSGSIPIVPNKNAILPALVASLLTDEEMHYTFVPNSPDAQKILLALEAMGASIVRKGSNEVTICCKGVHTHIVPSQYIHDMQAGYLFAGPLLARFGEAAIPISSGCKLGYRGHQDHGAYFKKINLGVDCEQREGTIYFWIDQSIREERVVLLKGEDIYESREAVFQAPLVTPTENILLFLSLASKYRVQLSGIAQEPHVRQLIELLRSMGARIDGSGSTVTVTGVESLRGATFVAEADHIDYFGFMVLAVMTNSDLLLKVPVPLSSGIVHMNQYAQDLGIVFDLCSNGVLVRGEISEYLPVDTFPRADEHTFKMAPTPWPGFPVDSLPSFIALATMNCDPVCATQAHNWMYSTALKYVPIMKEMGAKIAAMDSQRALIYGTPAGNPYRHTASVIAPDVIEGARAIILCALAGGEYTIKNVEYVLRRNPDFFKILKELGANIEIL